MSFHVSGRYKPYSVRDGHGNAVCTCAYNFKQSYPERQATAERIALALNLLEAVETARAEQKAKA